MPPAPHPHDCFFSHILACSCDALDLTGPLNDAAAALVDDSFNRCFKSAVDEPWNWNFYLLPLWCIGVVIRNFILFPIRVVCLLLGFLLFFIGFFLAGLIFSASYSTFVSIPSNPHPLCFCVDAMPFFIFGLIF